MNSHDAINILREHFEALPERDRNFADSLLQQHAGRRSLSEKQWNWVYKLAQRATGTEQAQPSVTVGDFAGVITLFKKASEHLQFPKIRLALEDGRPIALSVAGSQARRPGTVNVTDGAPYRSAIWYGRVTPSGEWEKSERVTADTEIALAALLANLSADPAGVAARFGKLTGNCCFCNMPLSDERSLVVGYGPVCATNYGLQWGPAKRMKW